VNELPEYNFYHMSNNYFNGTKNSTLIIQHDKTIKTSIKIPSNHFLLLNILKAELFPTIAPINKQTMNLVFTQGTRAGVFLLTSHSELNEIFTKLATELKSPELLFFIANVNEKEGKALYDNLDMEELPRIEVLRKNKRFVYKDNMIERSIKEFIEDYKNNRVVRFIKSEEVSKNDNVMVKAIGNTFDEEVLNNKLDVVVLFCSNLYYLCSFVESTFRDIGKGLRKNRGIKFVEIDTLKNDVEYFEVEYFPLIVIFPANHKDTPIVFKGERTEAEIVEFLKVNSDNYLAIPEVGIKGDY